MRQTNSGTSNLPPSSFTVIPIAVFVHLERRELNVTDLSVLCVLCKHRNNKTHMCNPSQTTIGDWINRSRTTVSNSIKKLVFCGLIELVAKANSREHRTNKYRILFQPSKATNVSPIKGVEFARTDRQDFIELSRKVGDKLYKEKGV